jgi:hypothetical protein
MITVSIGLAFLAALWAASGLLILLPQLDEHRCVTCLVIMALLCAVLGPLVWIFLALLIAGRIVFNKFQTRSSLAMADTAIPSHDLRGVEMRKSERG